MDVSRLVVEHVSRPDPADVAALSRCPVSCIADVLGKQYILPPGVISITPGLTLCGPAVTCKGVDVLVRRAAIDLAQPGDVLVVAAGGSIEKSCFGSATATHMRSRSISGVVVDGAVRDVRDLRTSGFPTFAKGITARNYDYPVDLNVGAVNIPVELDGLMIKPGDLVVGDDDGLVIVPRQRVPGLAERVSASIDAEATKWTKRLGSTFGAVQKLRREGYEILNSSEGPL